MKKNLLVAASLLTFGIGSTVTSVAKAEDMFTVGNATYELVKISSLGGVVWIANRVDELESPRYFKSISDLQNFRSVSNEQ